MMAAHNLRCAHFVVIMCNFPSYFHLSPSFPRFSFVYCLFSYFALDLSFRLTSARCEWLRHSKSIIFSIHTGYEYTFCILWFLFFSFIFLLPFSVFGSIQTSHSIILQLSLAIVKTNDSMLMRWTNGCITRKSTDCFHPLSLSAISVDFFLLPSFFLLQLPISLFFIWCAMEMETFITNVCSSLCVFFEARDKNRLSLCF